MIDAADHIWGWSTRAGPPVWSPYAWRLFSFTLQRALHQPGSHPGVPYFSFFVLFLEKKKKKKKKSMLFLFLFFHHAPILLQKNLSTGANVNFNLSPMFLIVLNIIKLNVYEEIFMDPQEGWIIWLFFDIACIQINKDFKRIEEYYVKKICYIKSIGTMLLLSTYFTNFCLGWHPIYKSQSSIIN